MRPATAKNCVIAVAGGQGLRMGSELPKQFIPVAGKPLLMHTLGVFHAWDPEARLITVIPADYIPYWTMLCEELHFTAPQQTVSGGATRFESVKRALELINEECMVAVHDGVRPFVAPPVIAACFAAAGRFGAAVPAVPVADSVREMTGEDTGRPLDRDRLRLVQTPQVFRSGILQEAYRQPYSRLFTDDASVVEAAGYAVHLVAGNAENIKITTPADLRFAEWMTEGRNGGRSCR